MLYEYTISAAESQLKTTHKTEKRGATPPDRTATELHSHVRRSIGERGGLRVKSEQWNEPSMGGTAPDETN
jgi:hypothetical protein